MIPYPTQCIAVVPGTAACDYLMLIGQRLSRQVAGFAAACLFALAHNANAFISPGRPATRSSHQQVRFWRQQQQQPACRVYQATRGGGIGPTNGVHHGALPSVPTAGQGRDRTTSAGSDSDSGAVTMMSTDDSSQRGHFYGFGDPNHKPSILQIITAQRYKDVAEAKTKVSAEELIEQIAAFDSANGNPINLFQRIVSEEPDMAIAAEFKRASPSKGPIALDLVAWEQGTLYASVGAATLSVLTEPNWFLGSLEDMKDVRLATQGFGEGKGNMRPAILRKDFIVDEYQLLEARANGADTVLLIVAILEVDRLNDLIDKSRKLEMEPLVEVHTNVEMEIALKAGARVIGVNNRNLHTFDMDLTTTERVSKIAEDLGVPWTDAGGKGEKERIVLSALSGITGPADVQRFSDIGVSMVLVGETLMRSKDPAKEIRTLLGREEATPLSAKRLVKVCGVTNKEDALVAAAAGANIIGVIFAEGSPRRVTVEQAREIVKAVQGFGERKQPKHMEPPTQTDSNTGWFHDWAKTLIESSHRTPLVAGVFQNQPLDEIRRVATEASLDLVQLHGDEGMEACGECGVPAMRVVHVPAKTRGTSDAGIPSAEARARFILDQITPGYAAAVLLDTTVDGVQGGAGVTFDHEVAKLVGDAGLPVIVAGGLNADNVGQTVIDTQGFGVDVSSGVEASKGVKDHELVKKFLTQARDG